MSNFESLGVDNLLNRPTELVNPLATPSSEITSGEITGDLFITKGFLRSKDFIEGVSGWTINDDGTAQFNNISLISSTIDAIVIKYGSSVFLEEGGNIRFTTVTAPTACTATVIAGTGLSVGNYSYKVTYENANGETELGTISNVVTTDVTNARVNLTNIPISTSSSVIRRKIYRTKAGGSEYYLLYTFTNNTSTALLDFTADASLTGGVANYLGNDSYGKILVDNIVVFSLNLTNSFLGLGAGYANITGGSNTFLGVNSGYTNTIGSFNVFIGNNSGYYNTEGICNLFIGKSSGVFNTIGKNNVFLGYASGNDNISGDNNVFLGALSGLNNTTGLDNVFIGYYSGFNNTTGQDNVFVGSDSGVENTDGIANVFIGSDSGRNNITGDANTYIGNNSGYNSTGDDNVFLGNSSGFRETGSNKLIIDNAQRASEADQRVKALIYGIFDASIANQLVRLNGILELTSIKSGATQAGAGAAANEVWKTASHATLPDNVLMIGV